MTDWNPNLYLQFQNERTQPAEDLAARIELINPATIIDLGCGPGNSTQVLRARWTQARISGLDRSPKMIDQARADYPWGNWILADAATWTPTESYSIVFSNAALQWIPGHDSLLPRLFGMVRPGGALAVQVPANSDSPLHRSLLRVSGRPEWKTHFSGCDELITYHPPGYYYDLLTSAETRVTIWQTMYFHRMENHQGLMDWYASTGMKPYLDRLHFEEERARFQNEILQECVDLYPLQKDGRILFPFHRTFWIAYRKE
jgi:trans-aconitate 2-methyltransferase